MGRDQCWLTFTEALEMYLVARASLETAPHNSRRYDDNVADMEIAKEHMNALTGDK